VVRFLDFAAYMLRCRPQ